MEWEDVVISSNPFYYLKINVYEIPYNIIMANITEQLKASFAGSRFGVQHVSGLDNMSGLMTNTPYNIERSDDAYWCEAIRIDRSYDINHITSISIGFNDKGIEITVPICIVKNLCVISQDKQYNVIHLSPSLFFKHGEDYSVPIGALPNKTFSFRMNSDIPIQYDLIGRYTYYGTELRQKLIQTKHQIIANTYENITVQDGIKIKLPDDGLLSGFFVESCKEPSRIKLFFNDYIMWNYDNQLLQHAGQLINKKQPTQETQPYYLYWFSIDLHKKWNEVCNLLNLSTPYEMKIEVDGCDCKIYFMIHKEYVIG